MSCRHETTDNHGVRCDVGIEIFTLRDVEKKHQAQNFIIGPLAGEMLGLSQDPTGRD